MKKMAHISLTLTIILSLLYTTNVYGGNPNKSNDTNKGASTSTGRNSNNQASGNVIKPVFASSHSSSSTTNLVTFSIRIPDQEILKYPKRLDRANFNDVILMFQDDSKLPINPVTSITIYNCMHGKPILIKLKSDNQNYFYLSNPETGKWSNHIIELLKEFEKTDQNGVVYYEYDLDDKSDNNIDKFNNQIDKVYSKLSSKICLKKCSGEKPKNQTLKIILREDEEPTPQRVLREDNKQQNQNTGIQNHQPQTQSNKNDNTNANQPDPNNVHPASPVLKDNGNLHEWTIRIESSPSYTYKIDDPNKEGKGKKGEKIKLFTYYSYLITKVNMQHLAKAELVNRIKFNETTLKFDKQTKLPDHRGWGYLRVFICAHTQTVMFRIKLIEDGKNYHYYYALQKDNTLKNVAIDSLDEKSETDANGLIRHLVPKNSSSEEYSKKIAQIWPELFEPICQDHNPPSSPLSSPSIELTIVSTEPNPKEGKK